MVNGIGRASAIPAGRSRLPGAPLESPAYVRAIFLLAGPPLGHGLAAHNALSLPHSHILYWNAFKRYYNAFVR